MALQVSGKRVFKYTKDGKSVDLEDPNSTWSPEAVMDFYSNQYPELVTGNIKGPELGENDVIIYQLGFTPKTKG